MKNFKYSLIMIIALSIGVVSCSNDDDYDHNYHLETVNVISVDLPDEFKYGSMYEIDITISLPNSCYFYYDQLDYIYDGTTRLIYPIAHVDDGNACSLNTTETTFSIPIMALQTEPYIFKFYQGKDANGKDTFLTIKVPVNNRNQKSIADLDLQINDNFFK